jgi:hypothetical protein
MYMRIHGHKTDAELDSELLGLRCWTSLVTRDAISLLRVARSLLKADDALASSAPAGAPVVVSEA